ncbi:hypothetical protein M6B38_407880 [Iris pallida]|uniref:Uncharacterized protein n=1 Tax=Iris pallida TaxID=29817 RepID=A0AAX6FQC0_IRIPA|nr:hypothetical protein M6B38_407880 [Iris pallida]
MTNLHLKRPLGISSHCYLTVSRIMEGKFSCSIDEEVHCPLDLFQDCESLHSILGAVLYI